MGCDVWVGLYSGMCFHRCTYMNDGCIESEDKWCACIGIEEWQCIVMWCVGMWGLRWLVLAGERGVLWCGDGGLRTQYVSIG